MGGGILLPVKEVSYKDEEVIIKTSGESLPQAFFRGMEGASCRLKITDGINNVSSSYFSLAPDNTAGGFFFKIQDLKGNYYEPFLVEDNIIHVSIPKGVNLSALYPIFMGQDIFMSSLGFEITGKQAFDFADFTKPFSFKQITKDGVETKWTVNIYDLPVVEINTPNNVEITSRYDWLGKSSFIIRDTDGTVEDYGETNVKGRGNWSWRLGLENGKKPYAIKLEKKPKDKTVLGMPGHKRWVLLANGQSFLPNPVGFEVNRRAQTCKWAPHSRFVELILNGKHRGLYTLCEHIKIDKNRVNIKEMKKTDTTGEAVTGGYLLSFDDAEEDDDPTYRTQYYNMPYMVKAPDTDEIAPEQLSYISDYLNEVEFSLYDDDKFSNNDFYNYFDIDSWIDYFFVAELWGALELSRPRSVWLYKDRGGKLTAGPLWDFESNFFDKQFLYCKTSFYYNRLLQSNDVINRMKEKWGDFRSSIVGNSKYVSILDYIDSLYDECHHSADRDRKMTPASFGDTLPPYTDSKIDIEYQVIHDNILVKLDWLESQIMSW